MTGTGTTFAAKLEHTSSDSLAMVCEVFPIVAMMVPSAGLREALLIACSLFIHMVQLIGIGASVGVIVGSCVGALGFCVGASVGSCVGASVGSCVGASVGSCVGASVGSCVGASVGSCVIQPQPVQSQW